ncbi:hypothetical protein K402DRAFT_184938 [Aulographum hederae CBS 113979]|uniref:DUF3176 domain-containing protein n=1 Tax=Aulographum hederae CBS 113979 TaxID=1176131 RepID=A0A6G1GPU1_9PEZI|nr:hypothetical protein K402DRAFT_184938 [Aulographum hederae CBS 113979]
MSRTPYLAVPRSTLSRGAIRMPQFAQTPHQNPAASPHSYTSDDWFTRQSDVEAPLHANPEIRCSPNAPIASPLLNPFARLETPPSAFRRSRSSRRRRRTFLSGYKKPTQSVQTFTRLVAEWWFDMLSWYVSALCLVAIVILLFNFNEGEVPIRWPLGININVYISVLSGVLKSSMLNTVSQCLGQLKWDWYSERPRSLGDFERFDDASRGPWGSLVLLIGLLRNRARSLACIGAAVTILSVAFDPFFQQIVTFSPRPIDIDVSVVNRSVSFSPDTALLFINNHTETLLDENMNQILLSYFLGQGSEVNPPMHCPTGNCTWPEFTTVGMCSNSSDVSELLRYTCQTSTGEWLAPQRLLEYDSVPEVYACGWYLNATSDSPALMAGYVANSTSKMPAGDALTMRMLPLLDFLSTNTLYDGSFSFKDVQMPIADFFVSSTENAPGATYAGAKPVLLEVVLYWCTKTIKAVSDQGRYREEIISTFYNQTKVPYPWTIESPDTTYMGFPTMSPPGVNETFFISNETAYDTLNMFNVILPSYSTSPNANTPPQFGYSNIDPSIMPTRAVNLSYDPWITEHNIGQHWEDIATALTNHMRSSSNGSVEVYGKAWTEKNFVQASWGWLALPNAVVFTTLLFLILTMLKGSNRNGHVGIWKTSSLAVLLNGLREDTQTKLGVPRRMREARRKASQLEVQLMKSDDEKWKLARTAPSPMVHVTPSSPLLPVYGDRAHRNALRATWQSGGWI